MLHALFTVKEEIIFLSMNERSVQKKEDSLAMFCIDVINVFFSSGIFIFL